MSLLKDNARQVIKTLVLAEAFWGDRLDAEQALAVNSLVQNLPERSLTDGEISSARSKLVSHGLESHEADKLLADHQVQYTPTPPDDRGPPPR